MPEPAWIFHFIIVILPAQQSSDESALAILSPPAAAAHGEGVRWHINIYLHLMDVRSTCAGSRMFRRSNVKNNNNNDTQKMRA